MAENVRDHIQRASVIQHVSGARMAQQMRMHRLQAAHFGDLQQHAVNAADVDGVSGVGIVSVTYCEKHGVRLQFVLPHSLFAFD